MKTLIFLFVLFLSSCASTLEQMHSLCNGEVAVYKKAGKFEQVECYRTLPREPVGTR